MMSTSTTSPTPPSSTKPGKSTLLSLPISPSAPIYHLPPDPLFPTPDSLFQLSSYDPPQDLGESGPVALKVGDPVPPSMLRKSRQVQMGGTFTYTSPLPLQFPYDLDEPGVEPTGPRKPSDIERKLSQFEIDPSKPVHDVALPDSDSTGVPTAYTCDKREASTFPQARLLSVSKKLLEEWLPQLDVGKEDGTEEQQKVRQQFIDVVSGKTVLARKGKEGKSDTEGNGVTGFAPWSQAYAGWQFGNFAGQLGDGRAISILSTPPTEEVASATGFHSLELQLKGAGRTPYSRFADGLAVLRSSVREYLGAEALAALRVPTSRALALVHLPAVHVLRERLENAAIVTRVSGSWLRIGSFELPFYRQEWETLRKLSSYTGRHVFGFDDSTADPANRSMAFNVVREVSRRTALMIAGWQAYGFCHGVMNTDNFALNGTTIDFGPYAFMDVFDSGHICNHSDDLGRYAYNKQPTMGVFAIDKLGAALAPLIGKEVELAKTADGTGYVEASQGWTGDEDSEEVNIEEYSKVGKQQVEQIKEEFVGHFKKEYSRLMRLKLGFTAEEDGDFQLFSNLLDLMERNELDFTNSFRLLSQFTSVESSSFPSFLDALLNSESTSPAPKNDVSTNDRSDWTSFFKTYESRLSNEGTEVASTRRSRMNSYNPRFTLRQWVLEETIKKLGMEGEAAGLEQLNRVLEMAQNPFEAYGETEIGAEALEACPTEEETERRRLAGVGPKDLLGFQCSCSS
ncbi:Fmp40p [Sporobolomyces salmoneus]|uniref:Fmp40p n=1 Tax=Sporobolomyces salmoneus TaxID=183962 RepID=UPI00317FD032